MDVLMLSRLQFASTAFFHFLFVPLTLGLAVMIAIMETIYVKTGDEDYKRMAQFWGKLFIINFMVGIVTGITLEFQFGTNWSNYSIFVGDIFGALLAIEASAAFYLESTFIAVWIFGWNRISPKLHAASIWIVAIASNISAFWILAANSWMQHPVGYEIRNGRAELTDFIAVITQKYVFNEFVHMLSAAYILGAVFIIGVSAFHIMRKNEEQLFRKSLKIGVYFLLIFSMVEIVQGHMNGAVVAEYQPTKLAAMEALWETQESAPQTLILWPDEKNERNYFEFLKAPGALSLLAYHDSKATVKGLKEWPKEERPPVLITFLAFRIMVALGFLFPVIGVLGFLLLRKNKLFEKFPVLHWALVAAIPLPYIAIECGWCLAEVGRQPWIVYGLMKTSDAVSSIDISQVAVSFAGFMVLYSIIGAIDFYLLYKYAKKGPGPADAASGKEEG
jgi:cytochrome bd ubiquinol oxidase subunit I